MIPQDFKLHFIASAALTLIFAAMFLFGIKGNSDGIFGVFIASFTLTMLFGVCWEILQDIYKDGSFFSTKDLLADASGALLAGIIILIIYKI